MSSTRISRLALALLLIGQARATVVITNDIPTPVARYTFNNDAGAGTTITADIGTNCTMTTGAWGEDPVSSGNYYVVLNGTTTVIDCGTDNDSLVDLSVLAFGQFVDFGEANTGRILSKTQSASTNFSWTTSISDSTIADRMTIAMQNTSALPDRFGSPAGSLTAYENSGTWVLLGGSIYNCTSMACEGFISINGIRQAVTQEASATGSLRDDTAFILRIGSLGNGSNTWNGKLDDVELYSPHIDQFQVEYRYLRGRLPLVPDVPDTPAINETDCTADFADVLVLADRFDEQPIANWGAGGNGCNPWPGNERQ